MPLPLTISCSSKIQIGFTFLVPAHPGSPGQRAVKRVCVCVVTWSLTGHTGRRTDIRTDGRTLDRYVDPPLDTYTLSNYLRFDPFVWPQPVLFIYYLSEINKQELSLLMKLKFVLTMMTMIIITDTLIRHISRQERNKIVDSSDL